MRTIVFGVCLYTLCVAFVWAAWWLILLHNLSS